MNKEMTSRTLQWALIGLGGVLFNFLFWAESLGVNALIFALFILAGSALLHYQIKVSWYTYGMIVGGLYGATMVVIHGSAPAKLLLFASAILALGFAQAKELRTLFYATGMGFRNLFKAPTLLFNQIKQQNTDTSKFKIVYRNIKFAMIPVTVTLVFWWIFRAANPVFNEWMKASTEFMGILFGRFFELFSFGRLLFLVIGLLLSIWFFVYGPGQSIINMELLHKDDIKREKKRYKPSLYQAKNQIPPFNFMGLRQEYRTGMLMMAMVTTLAAFVNMIDVVYVWFGFEYDASMNLSQFVHEGTYLLILSILLSMGIMLYFFRGNLNFYLKQEKLRWVAYTWIAQNVIMCISVALRNYQYIHYCGLTYKRIGVYCFLGLTLVGLITLLFKIKEKKSTFYLLRTNAWALYGLVVFLASFNWDVMIATHNLTHWNKEKGPYQYLLEELSDKALPILHQYRGQLEGKKFRTDRSFSSNERYVPMDSYLEKRINNFIKNHNDGWLSWTWSESNAYEYFIHQYEYDAAMIRQDMRVDR